MYGNIESSQDPCSTEENLYEPLDPLTTVPSQKDVPGPPAPTWMRTRPNQATVKGDATSQLWPPRGHDVTPPPPSRWSSKEKLVLVVGVVLLGVSVLLNVVFLAVGSRRIAALTEELEETMKTKEAPNVASRTFLMFNQHHSKCVVARGQQLTAATCQPEAPTQRFQWLRGGRLRAWASQECVTATEETNFSVVKLEPCRDEDPRQRWQCGDGGLLALVGHQLYFNYGNHHKYLVMLYTGDREWSRWLVYGSKEDICSRSCCPPCSKGWVYFQNSCYFYSKTASSWEKAQSFCSILGAQLLEVDGPEEREHLRTMLQSSSWLGIRDEEVEGTWKRENGTILLRDSSYWHRNEPNGGRQENCAVLREDGEWYDYPCATQLPWICEGHP